MPTKLCLRLRKSLLFYSGPWLVGEHFGVASSKLQGFTLHSQIHASIEGGGQTTFTIQIQIEPK